MTPLQFAKAECANLEHDNGGCKGIGIRDDGSSFSFGRKPACLLVNKARCQYFEECVLPMGIETSTAAGQVQARHLAEVKRLYAFDTPGFSKKKCRKCQACRRREVEPRKRLCYVCAEASRKESNRRTQRERRKEGSDEGKTPSKTPANIGSNEGVEKIPV
jgi:hypothetical protein